MELNAEKRTKRIRTYVNLCERCVLESFSDPNFSYQMLSDEIGITPYYLGTIFKLEKGESIREYVNTIRLERACELLDDTDYTVKSIAEMVGFISCNHFFMSFKRKYGTTPQKYRMKAS